MPDWTEGYVAEVEYTHGYYGELNPLKATLPFLIAGLTPTKVKNACELGFGQGVSLNIHAAASDVTWWGTDFNPSQVQGARQLANSSSADLRLFDDAFEDFVHREDLPDFDFIALHGIWSWISTSNRELLAGFIKRKLAIGGTLYISYNTLPGWSNFAPLRHLMTQHADIMSATGTGILDRIERSIDFATDSLRLAGSYNSHNPLTLTRLEEMKDKDRNYLAHEYFNKDWRPVYFSEVRDALAGAKLSFACSANYGDHVDSINLTADQQKLLAEITEPEFRQGVRDFLVNQSFRRDYWVKGPVRTSGAERVAAFQQIAVALINDPVDISMKTKGSLGEVTFREEMYKPIIEYLAIKSIAKISDIETELSSLGVKLGQIVEALTLLINDGHVAVTQSEEVREKCEPCVARLNRAICQKSKFSDNYRMLASTVTGGGISIGRFAQLFLLAKHTNDGGPDEWANFAWDALKKEGQKLLKGGATLESDSENIAALTTQAKAFADSLDRFARLGVVVS